MVSPILLYATSLRWTSGDECTKQLYLFVWSRFIVTHGQSVCWITHETPFSSQQTRVLSLTSWVQLCKGYPGLTLGIVISCDFIVSSSLSLCNLTNWVRVCYGRRVSLPDLKHDPIKISPSICRVKKTLIPTHSMSHPDLTSNNIGMTID